MEIFSKVVSNLIKGAFPSPNYLSDS
jgi:hypothetical protein